ncbi:MAG: D-sedoheptulose 7-phosphate isomerase [Bdellovibrionales bacterium]|nr:D-sedoheptulose 7-phosphate isomerase [Bdellovibrionales bacterium]
MEASRKTMDSIQQYLRDTFEESLTAKKKFFEDNREQLIKACEVISSAILKGHKLMICGNGGSAADAQHMAAEMVGRMLIERNPLPAMALTTDTSNITAIANDYSYDVVFEKQVQGLGRSGDVLLGISTSGNSKNVIKAAETARSKGMKVISMTGGTGGKLREISDVNLNVELGRNSSRIQETHIFIVHSLVDLMDRFFLKE